MLSTKRLTCVSFLSTPSARRATDVRRWRRRPESISIHALREEGDPVRARSSRGLSYFYPRPPRGGRPLEQAEALAAEIFLSTPSARRATRKDYPFCRFSMQISIHALREEGDERGPEARLSHHHFYPRPPRGGRPDGRRDAGAGNHYFYPRPPRGGRPNCCFNQYLVCSFLSTPSARRATGGGTQ